MMQLTIEVQDKIKDNKSRSFSAILLGYIAAPLWEGAAADTMNIRPVYLSLAGTETSLRPFLANLKRGAKALLSDTKQGWVSRNDRTNIECLRSAGYETFWHRHGDTAIVTLYLPEVFAVDPGMIDPDRCDFLSMPPLWWCEKQSRLLADKTAEVIRHAAALGLTSPAGGKDRHIPIEKVYTNEQIVELIPMAGHFAMMLDRRTRRPLINDMRFSLQIYIAAFYHGLASVSGGSSKWSGAFKTSGTDRLGFASGTLVLTTHKKLDEFLAQQIAIYQEITHVAS